MEGEAVGSGKIVLIDGTEIEVPVAPRDLVNGGVIVELSKIESLTRNGADAAPEAVFPVADGNDSYQVWIPGTRILHIVLPAGQQRTARAGFLR